MSPSRECSECGKRTKYQAGRGRPRETCSLTCFIHRNKRLKRERAAWERQTKREQEYLDEFRREMIAPLGGRQ